MAMKSSSQKMRRPITPIPKKPQGHVTIIVERCKGCEFCVEFCPCDVLSLSSKFNAKGYHFPIVEQPEQCVNCQLCYYLCPEFAIFVTPTNNTTKNEIKGNYGTTSSSFNR